MIANVSYGNLINNALKGYYDVMVHGCNCFTTMGKGIALDVKTVFPEAYAADCKTIKGDASKLGTYSCATLQVTENKFLTVVNAYTQYNYAPAIKKPVDYDAIRKAFIKINNDFKGKNIGIPLIGAGLAGGDWTKIIGIIKQVCMDVYIHVVHFDLKEPKQYSRRF